jgi:hypothetical protein
MFRPGPAGSPYSDFPLISGGGGPGFVDFFESLGRTIAFHPELARMLGSRNAALFLQQLMWWTPKGKDPDGWIYKSAKEWEEETTLTYEEQRALRALLGKKKLRVVEERYARFEHRLYFRVNRKRLNALWDAWIGEAHGEFPGRHRGNSQVAIEEIPRSIVPGEDSQEKTAGDSSYKRPGEPGHPEVSKQASPVSKKHSAAKEKKLKTQVAPRGRTGEAPPVPPPAAAAPTDGSLRLPRRSRPSRCGRPSHPSPPTPTSARWSASWRTSSRRTPRPTPSSSSTAPSR